MSESASAWVIRIPADFLDSRTFNLTDRQRIMALILDGMARESALCIPGNAKLAAISGRTERVVQDILDELEAAGRIRRVYADTAGQRRARVAILLLERVDPNLPRVPMDRVDEVTTALLECRKQHSESDEISILGAMKTALAGMLKTAPKELRTGTKTKRTMTKIIRSPSSSSHDGSQGRGEGSTEQASFQPPTDADIAEVVAKATALFDGSGIPAKAEKLCRDYGKGNAMEGLVAASKKARSNFGGDPTWGFVVSVARNQLGDGGPTGKVKRGHSSEEFREAMRKHREEREAKASQSRPIEYHVAPPRPAHAPVQYYRADPTRPDPTKAPAVRPRLDPRPSPVAQDVPRPVVKPTPQPKPRLSVAECQAERERQIAALKAHHADEAAPSGVASS